MLLKQNIILPVLLLLGLNSLAQKKDTVEVIGVGDIMLGTNYPSDYLPPGDGARILKPVQRILRNADITFGNYEGTLFDGEGNPKKCKDSTRCYVFRTPEKYAQYLKDAGFDMMSIANNHAGDFGAEGRKRTIEVLEAAGIAAAGSYKKPYTIIKKNGVTYGLAAFAPNYGTPDLNNTRAARKTVAMLDSLCDVVIVSFHGGAEGLKHQHVTKKREIFLEEDRGNVYAFARAVIDAGADIVFGHGPHVARAVDLYKNRFIVYSLGNFATYGRFNLRDAAGIAPIIKVFTDSEGKFIKAKIYAVRQWGDGGPVPDPSGKVIRKIIHLTKTDFPESVLDIKENGTITIKKD